MKNLLPILSLIVSTLCADIFDDSEVSYSYNIEMNDDKSVIKYLVDSTYYEQFSAEVLGVYILYNDIPVRISKDLKRMTEILEHYIFLKENPNYKIPKKNNPFSYENAKYTFNQIRKSNQLFQITAQEFTNQEADARDLSRILEKHYDFTTIGLTKLHSSLEEYLDRKISLYTIQNNKSGLGFCNSVQRIYLSPIWRLKLKLEENDEFNRNQKDSTIRVNYKKLGIRGLNKDELKLVWDEFKNSKLGLINAYFNANVDKLEQLDADNTFQIEANYEEWNGLPKYYICLNIFDQKWFIKIDDYYVSDRHKVSLIQL